MTVDTLFGLLKVCLYKSGLKTKIFDVYLESGDWPTDEFLVDYTDGGDPESIFYMPLHNGGKVELTDDPYHKVVTIFR